MTQNADKVAASVDGAVKKEVSVPVQENGSGGVPASTAEEVGTAEQDVVKRPGDATEETTAASEAASGTHGEDDSKPADQAAPELDVPVEQDAAAQAQSQEPVTAVADTTAPMQNGGTPLSGGIDDEVKEGDDEKVKEAEPNAEPAGAVATADSVAVDAAKAEEAAAIDVPSGPAASSAQADQAETAAADPVAEESTATAADEPTKRQHQPQATSEAKESGKHDTGDETKTADDLPAPAPAAADEPAESGKQATASADEVVPVVKESEGNQAEEIPIASAPEPAKDSTAETLEAASAATSVTETTSATPPGTVQALSRRLSNNALNTPPPKAAALDKQLASSGGSGNVSAAGLPGRGTKSPQGPTKSGEASPLSAHDTKNTINVSQLLKMGAFKMQPLKDFVPYEELQRLRVEDGIDATRKEDYLSDPDFQQVFGMDRDAFKKQPAWRQAQAKKKANLF